MIEFSDGQWLTFWALLGTFIYILGKYIGSDK